MTQVYLQTLRLKKYFIHNKLISINQNLIDEISKFNEKKTSHFIH